MRRRVAILLLFLLPAALGAQERHWEATIGGEYLVTAYSFRSPHNTFGTSLGATWFTEAGGRGVESALSQFPTTPYSLGVRFDLGITPQNICGYRLAVAPVLRSPLLPWLDVDLGLGLATYTKPRYATGDTANVYITTPVVYYIDLGLVAHLDERAHVALRLLHSSNGNIRRPNRGLNFLHLELGMKVGMRRAESGKWKVESGERRVESGNSQFSILNSQFSTSRHELGAMLATGLTFSRTMAQSGVYPCYNLSLNYHYRRSASMGFGATVDLWYNFSHRWQVQRYGDPYRFPMYLNAMPFVEFFWGPISLRGGIGLMLLTSGRVVEPVYERLGVYYHFGHHYAGIGINAHYGQAEFVEWSYGFRIPLRKGGR